MTAQVIVCLHGLGRSSADWDGVRVSLGRLGQVVTPDLPREVERAYRIAAEATPDEAIVLGHSLVAVLAVRLAAEPEQAIRGLVLSSSFFPPARNGRSMASSVADYARHRAAYVRELSSAHRPPGSRGGSVQGLGFLVRSAAPRSAFRATTKAVNCPVLVVHAVDDHYVPIDLARAAVTRRPSWELAVLDRGGHHPHVRQPAGWLAVVEPWLGRLSRRR